MISYLILITTVRALMCPIVDYVRHRDRLYNIPMNSSTQIIPLGLPSAPSLPPTAGTRTGGGVPTTLKKGTIVWSKRAYHGKVLQVNDGTYDIVEYGTGDRFTINPEVDDIKNESAVKKHYRRLVKTRRDLLMIYVSMMIGCGEVCPHVRRTRMAVCDVMQMVHNG